MDKNISVTEAALAVGYESVSPFIRDYKKMFAYPPKEDRQRLCKQLGASAILDE